jgi:hypothetical protein
MTRYSSPDRAQALSILQRSAAEQAAKTGAPLSTFIAEQAAIGIQALDVALARPGGSKEREYRAARDRLAADASYVFEYYQDQVEDSFNDQLNDLHSGLSRSRSALNLVDLSKVRTLLGDTAPAKLEVTPDVVISALHRVQVVVVFDQGFDAYASENEALPKVTIGYGMSKLLWQASYLIVAHGMRETSPGISNPHNLREHPAEYQRAVEELESVIRSAESGMNSVDLVTTAPGYYDPLIRAIAGYALSFFMFHELGHHLVACKSRRDKKRNCNECGAKRLDRSVNNRCRLEEELTCDEFAAGILGSSDDDRCWLGAAMASQLLSIVLRISHTEWRSAEYPGASYRASRISRTLRLAGARIEEPVDYLLAVPSRVYEQEVFETDTRRLIFFSYASALVTRWGTGVEPATVVQLALVVLDYATRLPAVAEHPEITCWNDVESGQRAYVITLEPYRALRVAGWALAEKTPQWQQLAAEAALLLISDVNHDPPPTAEAASLFLSLAHHKRGAARRDRTSLEYLHRIGAIVTEPALFPRSTGTTLFYHGQSPGDGYVPLSDNAVARRQLGSIIAAWEEYSSRTDRETPWFKQRGVTAIENWPP